MNLFVLRKNFDSQKGRKRKSIMINFMHNNDLKIFHDSQVNKYIPVSQLHTRQRKPTASLKMKMQTTRLEIRSRKDIKLCHKLAFNLSLTVGKKESGIKLRKSTKPLLLQSTNACLSFMVLMNKWIQQTPKNTSWNTRPVNIFSSSSARQIQSQPPTP